MRNSGTTFFTSASAVMPCFFRRIGMEPCSTNWSGQPMRTTGMLICASEVRSPRSQTRCAGHDLRSCRRLRPSARRIRASGVHRLDPPRIDQRSGNSLPFKFAAASSSSHILPRPKIATRAACCTTSALPISSSFGCGLTGAPVPTRADSGWRSGRRGNGPLSRACRRTHPHSSAACARCSGCDGDSRCRKARDGSGRRRRLIRHGPCRA